MYSRVDPDFDWVTKKSVCPSTLELKCMTHAKISAIVMQNLMASLMASSLFLQTQSNFSPPNRESIIYCLLYCTPTLKTNLSA